MAFPGPELVRSSVRLAGRRVTRREFVDTQTREDFGIVATTPSGPVAEGGHCSCPQVRPPTDTSTSTRLMSVSGSSRVRAGTVSGGT